MYALEDDSIALWNVDREPPSLVTTLPCGDSAGFAWDWDANRGLLLLTDEGRMNSDEGRLPGGGALVLRLLKDGETRELYRIDRAAYDYR
jgi:hypothetical protein